jgi:hypothetical protein
VFAGELFLAMLSDGDPLPTAQITATVAQAVAEKGFRDSRSDLSQASTTPHNVPSLVNPRHHPVAVALPSGVAVGPPWPPADSFRSHPPSPPWPRVQPDQRKGYCEVTQPLPVPR